MKKLLKVVSHLRVTTKKSRIAKVIKTRKQRFKEIFGKRIFF